ncbi:hypothetical protein [Legionella cincinnatiensis]|uniref:Uncharacterized protein n=1 Tax=Legionella cincinnatiensis TaxID=28085 RepID=A0A378IJK9_9GAMM|nr:hypothetical protein [Legionella cincinnatiensis]KTC93914.1 hypothetical protein Lcin_0002 [Legionella cincinnatiensis]STX35120.1 Uncharacterised protein [Legionella cincinnatiensis]
MKINITKKEYRTLLDMLYIADWVMHSYTVKETKQNEYEALKQKLLSYFKEMEAEDQIEFSPEFNEHFEKTQYEELLNEKFIEPYEKKLFWDELIYKLSERDAIHTIGVEQYMKMDPIERMRKVEEIKEQYANEFEKHGIENLKLT